MGRYAYVIVGLVCFALVAPALLIDLPVAIAMDQGDLPGDVEKGIDLAEVFAHGVGIFFIGLAIITLDPKSRRKVVRLWLATIIAGLLVNSIKVQIVRDRPSATDLTSIESVSETFHGYHLGNWDDEHQAFVSGHTAAAFALAVALTQIYPHGRWLFFTIAILAGVQRITGGAHFPSDVFGGAGIGLITSISLYWPGPVARMFDDYELENDRASGNDQPSGNDQVSAA